MLKKIFFTHRQLLPYLLLTLIQLTHLIQTSQASTISNVTTDLNLSFGNLCEFVGEYQINESGNKNFCTFLPLFGVGYGIILNEDWTIRPELNASFPQKGRDPNIKRMALSTIINAEYKTSLIDFISGVGIFFTRISGPGGEAILNNGNSQDSFPLPNNSVFSRNLILNIGAKYNFNQEWSSEAYTHIFNLSDSEDRAFSFGLKFTYHLGEVI